MSTPEHASQIVKSSLEDQIRELNLPKVPVEEVREIFLEERKIETVTGKTNHFGDSKDVSNINFIDEGHALLFSFMRVPPQELSQRHFDFFKKIQAELLTKVGDKRGTTEGDAEYRIIYDYLGWVANKFTVFYGFEQSRRLKQGKSM